MRTTCCSDKCERRFECAKADINNEGMSACENFYSFGTGTYTENGWEIEHWCGELGNWGMFEQVEHKWNRLYEKTPPVNTEVELKVVYNGVERIYVNKLIPMWNGIYQWCYCDYDDCDEVVAWRHLPKY